MTTPAKNIPTCTSCGYQSLEFQAPVIFDTSTCTWIQPGAYVPTYTAYCPICGDQVDWHWADIKPVALSKFFPADPKNERGFNIVNISNDERVEAAHVALVAFINHMHINQEETRDQVVDLITNLFHLCDSESITVEAVVNQARTHYVAEKSPGGGV